MPSTATSPATTDAYPVRLPPMRWRHRRFARHLIATGGNGSEAARRTGYRDAANAAVRLTRDPRVIAHLADLHDEPRVSSPDAARRHAFATALLVHAGNATKAAIEVGYSETSAHVRGHRLLQRADVRHHLDAAITAAIDEPESPAGRGWAAIERAAIYSDDLHGYDRLTRLLTLASGRDCPRPVRQRQRPPVTAQQPAPNPVAPVATPAPPPVPRPARTAPAETPRSTVDPMSVGAYDYRDPFA